MAHMSTLAPSRTPRIVAAVLIAVLGIGIAGTQSAVATTSTASLIATAVFNQMNAERHANGLPALRMNGALVNSAHAHDLMMAKYNTLSHQLPGEASVGTRITNAGYRWSYAGENVAWTGGMYQSAAQALQTSMYNETPPNNAHRLNILSGHYLDVGVDVVLDNVHHKLWMTEDFGRPQ